MNLILNLLVIPVLVSLIKVSGHIKCRQYHEGYVQESYRNSLIFTKSVSSCMFLTLCVCLRNIQELTDFQNAGKVEKK